MTTKRRRRITRTPAPAGLKFEEAFAALRRGTKAIRRRAWAGTSRIFRLGNDVFLKLPNRVDRAPSVWHPYPEDFFATDWEVVSLLTEDAPTMPLAHMAEVARHAAKSAPRRPFGRDD
jgi:hypothetical protein